jgi:hypothetical protein
MAYQVGRVCAVAGYFDLYRNLNLLPEVHIAEEARDNGSLAIFGSIISQPVRYAVFNDYERKYEPNAPRVAVINGDICVQSLLELKQRYQESTKESSKGYWRPSYDGFDVRQFDITEDMCIDTYTSDREAYSINENVVIPLLYSPLSVELPTV